MPTYPTGDHVDLLDPATPAGTDSPAEIDDAIRQIKDIMGKVTKFAHTAKGGLRVATFFEDAIGAVAYPSSVANVWRRRACGTVLDPTITLLPGAFTNSVKLPVGVFFIRYWATGFRLGDTAVRLAQATSNVLSPSGSIMVHNSAIHQIDTGSTSSTVLMYGDTIITSDGLKSYCIDQISTFNTGHAEGWGRVIPGTWGITNNHPSGMTIIKLGAP